MSETPISIIIVNDQEPVCKLWRLIIEGTPGMTCPGYALNGMQAINLVTAHRPDIVLMDAMMPGLHGFDATRMILDLKPETLVIMYSAYSDTELNAYEAGAVHFLQMPVTPDALVDAIRTVFAKHHVDNNIP